jgi:hypothetical protein
MWRNKDGDKFIGQWKNNKAHGYGIYITKTSHYQGNQFITKVFLLSLSSTEKAYSHSKMEMSTRASIKMASHMDLGSIFGKMAPSIKATLLRVFDTGKEPGQTSRAIIIKVNSKTIKRTALGSLIGKTATSTKGSS